MKADPAIDSAVRATLDRLADVYVTRDVEVMRTVFAPDPDVVMYSPGAEAVVGRAAIEAKAVSDWSRSDAATLTYRGMSISAADDIAWVATEADFAVTADGTETTLPVRITFVLEQRDGEWLIQHAHYSFGAAPTQG